MAQSSPAGIVALFDLIVLAIAVPVFFAADFPLLGLGVAGGVWLVQRIVQLLALRRIRHADAKTTRNKAMGILAATMLGRVWTVALAILLVGLADREAGLAAAVLSAALVTAYLAGEGITQLMSKRDEQAA